MRVHVDVHARGKPPTLESGESQGGAPRNKHDKLNIRAKCAEQFLKKISRAPNLAVTHRLWVRTAPMVNEYTRRPCMITNIKTSLHCVDQSDLIKYAPHASPEFNAMIAEMCRADGWW